MVNLTIDGRAIQAEPGKTILEVAKENGIYIPFLCYHPALKPIGSCRICVVEIKPGPPRPLPACATTVNEGMEVVTNSPKLMALRQELMKLVLINHALECPICDKGGECELQDLTHALGVPAVDLDAVKLEPHHDYVSQLVERHPDRCVTCGRCVRICRDRVGAMAINFTLRGYFTELASGAQPLDCEFCGSCIDICPVGALINKQFKYRSRAWEVDKTEIACPFCGGGCTYQVHTKDGKIMRVLNEDSVLLCGRGRFGWPVVEADDRLKTPLIRENGNFREASWDEALDLVAAKFKETIEADGAKAVYGVGSPRATNEANFAFQKFFREGLATNQLDNPGRYNYVRAIQAMTEVFGNPKISAIPEPLPKPPVPYQSPFSVPEEAIGSGFPFVLGKLEDLPKADVVLVVDTDVTPELPPLGWKLLEAAERDTFRLVVANPRKTKFDRYASLSLRYKPGSERVLIAGLIKFILAENPDWTPAIKASGLDEFKESVKLPPKEITTKTGVDESALKEAAALLAQAQAPAIIFGTELLSQDKGHQNALALADLFLLVGKPEAPGSALYPVAEKNNSRGVSEVGVLPEMGPGFMPVEGSEPGPTLEEVLDLLEKDEPAAPKALYLLGGDLLRWLPHRSRVQKLLKKVPFMVVQDAFLTDTAKLAQVVLPVAVHAEQEGTFLSSTGQLGLISQALPVNGVRPDWQIISQIAAKMGFAGMNYSSPKEIFKELAKKMPLWAGLAPKLSAPCPLIKAEVSGKFVPFEVDISLPGRRPYTLIVGKSLQHSGSFTTHHPCGTLTVTKEAFLKMNPEDAKSLGLAAGETAKIISSQGEISVPVKLTNELPLGVVFLPEHFATPAANELTLNSNLVRVTIQKG
ncbi:MAG: molybdopterin-dependent oxidoreductase [Thermodesulfobacteriota bacterium]